jgi:hypothetical protein
MGYSDGQSAIISLCVGDTVCRGESRFLRNTSIVSREWQTGIRGTTLPPPNLSRSFVRTRRNLSANCRFFDGDSYQVGRKIRLSGQE